MIVSKALHVRPYLEPTLLSLPKGRVHSKCGQSPHLDKGRNLDREDIKPLGLFLFKYFILAGELLP